MNNAQQSGKRIVSRGRYVQNLVSRIVWIVFSALLYFMVVALVVFFLPAILLCAVVDALLGHRPPLMRLLTKREANRYSMTSIISEEILNVIRSVKKSSKMAGDKARQLDSYVPLTRANIADLPAPDSLVRASSESIQAQEGVLLRAATEGQETPPEQLVRTVNGQE